VYAGLGSHSGAYLPGDYLMMVDRNALGHLYTVGRRLARILLPWTRDQDHGAIGAPYIDYARGDGVCVGEGDRTLRCESIDDTTPWVNAYRGMWGHDTEDPFGGERGPAGPRYERSGQVRASWRDPVGWAGLAKVAPTDDAALASTARRAQLLDAEIEQLTSTRHEQLDALRSAHVLGEPTAELEAALAATTAALDLRTDEHFLIDHPPVLAVAGPHDHLRHRRVPMQADDRNRRRLLMIWAAISTPLVLIVLAFLALPASASITTAAAISLVVIFAIEAVARRRLFSYLATLVVVVLAVSVALAVIVALVTEWRFTTAGLLVVAAALIAVFNIAELRRQ
jgi:hypothetical protein